MLTSDVTALLGIVAAITVAAVSPGPTLLMVARTAVARSRGDGLAAALGIGVAGVLYAIAALAGLKDLLLSTTAIALRSRPSAAAILSTWPSGSYFTRAHRCSFLNQRRSVATYRPAA